VCEGQKEREKEKQKRREEGERDKEKQRERLRERHRHLDTQTEIARERPLYTAHHPPVYPRPRRHATAATFGAARLLP
jgi:hypothetical protein